MIYGHGNEIHKLNITTDFSSNVWYKGASEEICLAITQSINSIGNYPEPDAYSLKIKIAEYFNLNEDKVIITNGSTEAFYLIAQAYAFEKSVIVCPSFSEYYDACKMHCHQIMHLNNTFNWQSLQFENQLVWFANPNNPDGKTITLAVIESMLKNNPSAIFILDEAYIELCSNAETAIKLLDTYSNLLIIRSFTKAFSIPGLRLGYILSSKKHTDKIKRFLMPWNVNSLAIAAGVYVMENYNNLLPAKEEIKNETSDFQSALSEIKELKVYPSDCNFFMLQSLTKPASELNFFLIKEYGILIRDASNFRELDKSFFRVAIQKPTRNKILVKAIKHFFQL